jgi:hypothetical protein
VAGLAPASSTEPTTPGRCLRYTDTCISSAPPRLDRRQVSGWPRAGQLHRADGPGAVPPLHRYVYQLGAPSPRPAPGEWLASRRPAPPSRRPRGGASATPIRVSARRPLASTGARWLASRRPAPPGRRPRGRCLRYTDTCISSAPPRLDRRQVSGWPRAGQFHRADDPGAVPPLHRYVYQLGAPSPRPAPGEWLASRRPAPPSRRPRGGASATPIRVSARGSPPRPAPGEWLASRRPAPPSRRPRGGASATPIRVSARRPSPRPAPGGWLRVGQLRLADASGVEHSLHRYVYQLDAPSPRLAPGGWPRAGSGAEPPLHRYVYQSLATAPAGRVGRGPLGLRHWNFLAHWLLVRAASATLIRVSICG